MNDTKCPCKGCNDRTDSCHGTCEAYAEWTETRQRLKDDDPDKLWWAYSHERDYAFVKGRKRNQSHRRRRK